MPPRQEQPSSTREENIIKALRTLKTNPSLSLRRAAAVYNVCPSTLHNRRA
ncbi:hypothetical protein BS50DRAFT_474156, partial [Corynespora cassiicola Philippines]